MTRTYERPLVVYRSIHRQSGQKFRDTLFLRMLDFRVGYLNSRLRMEAHLSLEAWHQLRGGGRWARR